MRATLLRCAVSSVGVCASAHVRVCDVCHGPLNRCSALLCSALLCRRGIVARKGIAALLIDIRLFIFGGWTGALCQLRHSVCACAFQSSPC